MSVILLTGTIDPSVFNNSMTTLSDVQIRLNQYIKAIENWIKKSNMNKIVFIENSGYAFDYKPFVKMASEYNKQFEFISADRFVDETIKYGKSYGEIKIMNEAVNKSKLLLNEDSFYKCTGRLYIKNVNKIMKESHKSNTQFLGVPTDKWAFTWFFKVDKKFYMDVLYDSYKYVNDFNGNYLENIYYKKLTDNKNKIETFCQYPNVSGVSAGSNIKFHSDPISLFLKNQKVKKGYFGI